MSAVPPNLLTPNQIDTVLYKKYVNTPNAYTNAPYNLDYQVYAASKVFPGRQIYSQPIPDTAPTDLVTDSSFNSLYGTRQYSRQYPYMVKYSNIELTSLQRGVSYRSSTNIGATNLLQYAIPFNYDLLLSYDITVRNSTNGIQIVPSSATYPWSLDCDAGVLTFYGRSLDLDNVVPRITFWRYEGRMGLVPYDVCGNQIGGAQQSVGWSQSANGVDIYNTTPATARVAIGLEAPTATLDVSGTVRVRGQLDASGASIRTGTILPPGSQQPLTLLTDASGALRVGIGTSQPAYNLDVSGTARLARMEIAGVATMNNGLDVSGIVIARNIIAAPTTLNGATINSDPTVGIILKQASTTATNVGIGADPGSTTRLRVLGSSSLEGSVTVQNQLKVIYEQNDGNNAFVIEDQRNDTTPFIVDADGNVGVSADLNTQTGYAAVRTNPVNGVPYRLDVHGRTITEGLDVSGTATVGLPGSQLIVDASAVRVHAVDGLDVSGSARISGVLTAGSIALNSVAVTGASSFGSGIDVSGVLSTRSLQATNAAIASLTASGTAVFQAGIDVSGQTILRGPVAVGQPTTFDSSVQITGQAHLVSGMIVSGPQTNTADLQVTGRGAQQIFTADTSNNRFIAGKLIVDAGTGNIGVGKSPAAATIIDVSGDVAINNLLKLNTVGLKGGSGAGNTNFSLKLPGALPDGVSTLSADASGSLFWMADSSVWLNRYIIDAPPAITGAAVASRSTEIVFTWNYPTQIYAGFTDKLLPTITTFNAVLKRGADSLLTQILGGTSPSAAQFVKETASPAAPITGLILSSRTGTDGIITRSGRRYYVFYSYAPALDASNNRLTIWYSNFNAVSQNPVNIFFNSFGQVNPPAAPSNLRSTGTTAGSLGLLFTTGLVDAADATSTDVHSSFDISYNATANTVRYGGLVAHSGSLANWLQGLAAPSLTDVSGTLASLNPDTTYALAIRGRSQFAGLLGPYSQLASFTTGALAPATTTPVTIPFPTSPYYVPGSGATIKLAASGQDVVNVYNRAANTSAWTSTEFNIPIHTVANRGSGVPALARIRTDISSVAGPTVTLAGFATSAVPGAATASGLTLTPTAYADSYTTPAASTGYYRQVAATLQIAAESLVARAAPYTVNVYRDVSGSGGWQPTDTATHTFYVDNYATAAPALSGTPALTVTGTTINITGVPVISSASTVNAQLSINLQQLGTNFYRSPYLQYTCAPLTLASSQETVINPVNGVVPATVAVSRTTTFTGLTADSFARGLTLSYTAYNQRGLTLTGTVSSTAVIDSLPAGYVTSPPTLIAGGASIQGMHNGLVDASGQFAANYAAFSAAYDHTISIVGTGALQIVKRKWRTKAAAGTDGYAVYPTVNYSGIAAADYRVAAFTWALNQGSTYSGRYTITLTGAEGIDATNAGQILLFYRLANTAASTPTGPTSQSTVWINGALADAANPVGSSNYYDTTRSGILTGLVSRTVASTTVTYVVNAPPFAIPVGQNVALYVYVGLPMAASMAFSGVTVGAAA